ncbi:MAG TPA: discoidin domain-containing protein [Sumerlaeia bacterium]|nr:discoidin domain-containing protein [Sumerlaeia bacterium]
MEAGKKDQARGAAQWTILAALAALALAAYASAASAQTTQPKPAAAAAQAAQPKPPVAAAQTTESKPPAAAEEETTETQTESSRGDLVPLEVKLPKPLFVGTPKSLKSDNLEPPRKRPFKPLMVPKGTVNLARGKPVTASDDDPVIGELEQVADGDKKGSDGSYVELGPGTQWVQIDLGQECEIYGIYVWHFHGEARIYRDVVIRVADDPDFIMNVKTIHSNDHDNSSGLGVGRQKEYIETNEGRQIRVRRVKARYVRFYSNGNTSNDYNHYIECEVYGKPAGKE